MGAVTGIGAPPNEREGYVAWQVRAFKAIGSPGFEFDEAALADCGGRSFDRAHDPGGMLRQSAASLASGDRTEKLRALRLPTLVIHGAADVMCDVSGGRATAAAIPGAELVIIDGMGHNLPGQLWPVFADDIAALVQRVERA